jgi:hypothetical protein
MVKRNNFLLSCNGILFLYLTTFDMDFMHKELKLFWLISVEMSQPGILDSFNPSEKKQHFFRTQVKFNYIIYTHFMKLYSNLVKFFNLWDQCNIIVRLERRIILVFDQIKDIIFLISKMIFFLIQLVLLII